MKKEINLHCPINPLGYGVAGNNICAELSKLCKVNLFPIGPIQHSNKRTDEIVNECLKNSETANLESPSVKIWHQHQLAERIGNGRYFGFPIFELDTFTKLEKFHLNIPHELIVCSNWAKEVLEANGINKKIHVVPLGVDTEVFRCYNSTNDGPYKFFNIGKLEIRKGHDILLECFNRAFEKEDDVELHMMWDNPFLGAGEQENWEAAYRNSKLGSKIRFHSRVQEHHQVAQFINSMDCGVFPSRAEGWNLDLLEAMACGKPVITTNYSAHTEFCNKDNSFLVEIQEKEPAFDGKWFHRQGNWAYIRESHKQKIVDYMKFCYFERIDNPAGIEAGKKFTWKNSANELFNATGV